MSPSRAAGLMARPPDFSPRDFRATLGMFATGVTIVTARNDSGEPVGLTASSFNSVSLDPPLVAFFPAKTSTSWPRIAAIGKFCVNVLASDQQPLCRKIAGPGPDKFDGVSHRVSANGSPILDDVVAWIDCAMDAVHEAGDHYIVLGHVLALEVDRPDRPLLFFQGNYGEFALMG